MPARTGRRFDPAHGRASYLFNSDHRRHRGGGCDPPRRRQSAHRGVPRQRPHPQALAHGAPADRRDRRDRQPDLCLRVSRRRPRDPGRPARRPAQLRRDAEGGQAPARHRRAGRASRPDGAAVLAAGGPARARRSAPSAEGWNGFSVLHTAAARVGALDLGFVPGEGGLDAAAMARRAASTSCSTSAPTRSRSRRAPSWSTRARMATAARIAPTSSCRARPIPRSRAPT